MGYELERHAEEYESAISDNWILFANVLALFGAGSLWVSNVPGHAENVVPWAIAGAAVFILGRVADTACSADMIPVTKQAESLKAAKMLDVYPYIPEKPEREDFFRSWNIVTDGACLVVGTLFPPFGISCGVQGLMCTVNNLLVKQKIELKIKNHLDHDKMSSQDATKA